MCNTNTEVVYPFHCKIEAVFGLVSILFHCIYSLIEKPTIKKTQCPQICTDFGAIISSHAIPWSVLWQDWPLRVSCSLELTQSSTHFPFFCWRRGGEWEERCRKLLGPLSNHRPLAVPWFACPVPVPTGSWNGFSSLVPVFPQVVPGELKCTATTQCCASTNKGIAQPLLEQSHTKLSQAKSLPWDVPTFRVRPHSWALQHSHITDC